MKSSFRVSAFHSLPRVTIACPVSRLQWPPRQLIRGGPVPTSRKPNHGPRAKHATGPHSTAAPESREPRARGVGAGVRESSAPLPKRKPTIRRPAASTSAPTHSQRGRRQATKVESASCRGFHISARPAPRTPRPGPCASAAAPLQRGGGTQASTHPRRAYPLLRAGRRFLPGTRVSPPQSSSSSLRTNQLRGFSKVPTRVIQHPEAVRGWLLYFSGCLCTAN